ncbi:hypothetical protein, partial [Bartonella apis]|uniref:hypothetical protein n=1 Tax=Bartonella apis TaxID=1686310 RepID=UPI002430B0DE
DRIFINRKSNLTRLDIDQGDIKIFSANDFPIERQNWTFVIKMLSINDRIIDSFAADNPKLLPYYYFWKE